MRRVYVCVCASACVCVCGMEGQTSWHTSSTHTSLLHNKWSHVSVLSMAAESYNSHQSQEANHTPNTGRDTMKHEEAAELQPTTNSATPEAEIKGLAKRILLPIN